MCLVRAIPPVASYLSSTKRYSCRRLLDQRVHTFTTVSRFYQDAPSTSIRPERFKMLTLNDHAVFIKGDGVLKYKKESSFLIPCSSLYRGEEHLPSEKNYFYIGDYQGKKVFGVACEPPKDEEVFCLTPARDALSMTDQKTAQLISRAKHLLSWHKNTLFSGCCGTATTLSKEEIAKICQTCKKVIYPSYSNFVIVLIEKDGKLLLARSPHFKKGMYSAIAGFVEPGESYEDAVRREVQEEVGVEVEKIRYFGSQPWPFPSSLAAAFVAKHAKGEIHTDPKEIEDAQWFDLDKLPELPHPCSISRHIIDDYKKSRREE